MARTHIRMLLSLFLQEISIVHGTSWQEAPLTTPSQLATSTATFTTNPGTSTSALTTSPPQFQPGALEAPNICGYVNHDPQNPYTCAGPQTCLWTSSPLPLVGCGNPTSITFFTSCLPYRYASSCSLDSTCLSAPSILHCPSELPYCATARVGPDGNYTIRACQANPPFGRLRVELDYVGQTLLGHLPRWLGEDGGVTLGTVTPVSSPSSMGSTLSESNGVVNPATIPGGVFTVVVSSALPGFGNGGGRRCNATCREEKYEEQVRRQTLAGGLVGGFMALFGVGFGIWLVWAWRRKVNAKRRDEDGTGISGGYIMQNIGIGERQK